MRSTPSDVESQWVRQVRQQQASGLSVAAFCRRQGLAQATFYAWRKRLGRAGPPAAAASGAGSFVELKLAQEPQRGASALTLLLAGGRGVRVRRGFDPALLRELLAALEAQA